MENKLTYQNAYQQFKSEFKEDSSFFSEKERELSVDETDGAHVQFGMVVIPYLFHLVDIQNDSKIKECFKFFDRMSSSSDKELSSVVQFSILEGIVTNKEYFNNLCCYFTDEMKSYFPYMHQYIDF